MEMTDESARAVGRLMRQVKATNEEAIVVGLTLETEENTQEFFAWCRSQEQEPTWRACFEKAVEIRMENGPESEGEAPAE